MTSFDIKSISKLQIVEDIFGSPEKFDKLYASQNKCLQFGRVSLDKEHCLNTFNLIYNYLTDIQESDSFPFSMNSEYVALLGLFHHIFQNQENNYLSKKGLIFWKLLNAYDEFIKNLFENILKGETIPFIERMNEISKDENALISLIKNWTEERSTKNFTEFANKRADFINEFKLNVDYNVAYKHIIDLNSDWAQLNSVGTKLKEFEDLKVAFKILFFFDIYSGFLELINKPDLTEKEKNFIPRISHFILRIFVNSVGLYSFGELLSELKDLAFKNFDPVIYKKTGDLLNASLPDEDWTKQVEEKLIDICEKFPKKVKILQRKKSVFSAYIKALNYETSIDSLWDLYAFRLIIDSFTENDCYDLAFDILDNFTRWSNKEKAEVDYIEFPKNNGYQSYHIVITNEKNSLIEIQIRTTAMNEIAEYGKASHLNYKDQVTETEGKKKFQKLLKKHQVKKEDFEKRFMNNLYSENEKLFYEKIAEDNNYEKEVENQIVKVKKELKVENQIIRVKKESKIK